MMRGSLHRKLRLLRAELKLSLRQAAKRTGLAKETLSDLERGRRHPNDVTLAKIAEGYGISVGELFDLEEEPTVPKAAASPSPAEAAEEERRSAELAEENEERRSGGSPEARRAHRYLRVLGRHFDHEVDAIEAAAKRSDMGPGFLEFVESILENAYDEVTGELLQMLDGEVGPSEEAWLRTIEKDLDRLHAVDYQIYKSAEEAEEDAQKRDELRRRREARAADRSARRAWVQHTPWVQDTPGGELG